MSVIPTAPARSLLLALGASALASAVLAFGPSDSPAKPRTCRAKGSTTVRKSSHARVYQAAGTEDKVYGCLYSKDTRYLLTLQSTDCDPDLIGPDLIRLAGRYVGYTLHFCSEFGPGSDKVYVTDLVTGEVLVESRATACCAGGNSVPDLVLKANGSVAWTASAGAATNEVRKSDRTIFKGPRTTSKLLDAGEDIGLKSLTREGSTLTWTNAGAKKTAKLK